ncbi:MAG TPA: transposase, partial [Syntrophomonadaceae bacterium]|nr:transposase [Syntrophomonadaceae bacterium]
MSNDLENNTRIDHDRLFKELIETFFAEFMELFFPDIYSLIELDEITFLKEEIFTDVTRGDKHLIDLLVETKLKGEESIILVHVESQAQYQGHFAER